MTLYHVNINSVHVCVYTTKISRFLALCFLFTKVCDLEEDTPEQCEASGTPSLPDLPPLELPLSAEMIPQFLFVSEFLYTFADALGLKRRLTAWELSKLMAGGRGLGDLYLSLLKVREGRI